MNLNQIGPMFEILKGRLADLEQVAADLRGNNITSRQADICIMHHVRAIRRCVVEPAAPLVKAFGGGQ